MVFCGENIGEDYGLLVRGKFLECVRLSVPDTLAKKMNVYDVLMNDL